MTLFKMIKVVYIRKVKKSESKSQLLLTCGAVCQWLCISVKLKNLKANHNLLLCGLAIIYGCVYP